MCAAPHNPRSGVWRAAGPWRWIVWVDSLVSTVPGRVFLATLAVLVVTSYVLMNVLFQEDRFHALTEPQRQADTEAAQRTLELSLLKQDPRQVDADLVAISRRLPSIVRIDVAGPDDLVRYSTLPQALGRPPTLLDAATARMAAAHGVSIERSGDPGRHVLVRPVLLPPTCANCHRGSFDPDLGRMYVVTDNVAAIQALRGTTLSVLRLLAVIVLVLAIVLGIYVHLSFIVPARRFADHLRQLGDGPAPGMVDVATLPAELRQIAHAFNRGVESLIAARQEVERLQQERLAHVERLVSIGRLSAMLAHEIRNPLAGISSAVRILAEELPIKEEHQEIVDELQRQVKRLSRTLTELLSSSRPHDPVPGRLCPQEAVARAAHIVQPAFERRGLHFVVSMEPDTPAVYADEECLVQVLLNLLVNAEQAVAGAGLVRVDVHRSSDNDGMVAITVADNGPGMPPEVLARVGQPFFTTKKEGTGLGLAISREMVERMGGRLLVASPPGQGASVTVMLPAFTDQATPPQNPELEVEANATIGLMPRRHWKTPGTGTELGIGLLALLGALWLLPAPALAAPRKVPVAAKPLPKPGPSCVTSACHKSVLKKPDRHAMLRPSTCSLCHQPMRRPGVVPREGAPEPFGTELALQNSKSHPAGGFQPVRERLRARMGPPLPTSGPIGGVGGSPEAGPHSRAARGNCTLCHDPHAAAKDHLLRKPVPGLCMMCHQKTWPRTKFTHAPAAMGDCLDCHVPHAGRIRPNLRTTQPELCFDCHTEMKERLSKVRLHPPVAERCSLCHGPHGGNHRMFFKEEGNALCLSCHKAIEQHAKTAPFKHKALTKACTSCHDPHGTPEPRLLRQPMVALCTSCHEKVGSEVGAAHFLHGALDRGSCTGCHDPHGGSFQALLRGPFPVKKPYQAFEGDPYGLCFLCHERMLLESGKPPRTGFRNGDKNLHHVHVARGEKGRSCMLCHSPHGADQPHILREEMPFGSAKLPMEFTASPDGGSCKSACHEVRKYARRDIVKVAPLPAAPTPTTKK